jgi:hypothetical protein
MAMALLTTDAAVLVVYGAISMLMVPGAPGEAYLSSSLLFYGVLPVLLGVASLVGAVRLSRIRAHDQRASK